LTSETQTLPGEGPETRVIDVPGVPRFEVGPHHCFACGSLNASGMGLVLHVEPRRCWTELTLEQRFEGWDGIAHGGILCTVLDEVMAWSLVGEDNWGLTARISVEFKKPVETGHPIRAEGWITNSRRRLVDTAARIVDPRTGVVFATATGLYVAADEARKQELRQRYGYVPLADSAPAASPR
jgi:acyl-coenzyme A thioesterase PaaI-like protein